MEPFASYFLLFVVLLVIAGTFYQWKRSARGGGEVGKAAPAIEAAAENKHSSPPITQTAGVVQLPAVQVRIDGKFVDIPASTVSVRPATIEDVHGYEYELLYNGSTQIAGPNAWLPHKYARDVTVVGAEDHLPLTENNDYRYVDGGKIFGLVPGVTRNVLVSYTGLSARYDLVLFDPVTRLVRIVEGSDRAIDAEEYRPAVSPGTIPIFSLYVIGDRVHLISMAPTPSKLLAYEQEQAVVANHNQSVMRAIVERAVAGEELRLVGYGDSITAQGSGGWNRPDGHNRDACHHFKRLPEDTKQRLSRQDLGDGHGAIHTSTGWNWRVKAALQNAGSPNVEYLNLGVSRSRSDASDGGRSLKGGSHPDRLHFAVTRNPDLVVLCFGTNDMPKSKTFKEDMRTIVEAFQAVSATVLIVGVPRPSPFGKKAPMKTWRSFNERLWELAQETQCAFVPTAALESGVGMSLLGMHGHSYGNSNLFNHPNPEQLRIIGDYIERMIDSTAAYVEARQVTDEVETL